jgi:hypothetical protein
MLPPLISTVAKVDVPEAPKVVKEPVLGVDAPIVAASTEPPLISAVAATRLVFAFSVVNVPAAGVVVPIVVLSIAPEFRSIDVIVVVPVAERLTRVVSPVTPSVEPRAVAPVIFRVPPAATLPEAEIPPLRNKS